MANQFKSKWKSKVVPTLLHGGLNNFLNVLQGQGFEKSATQSHGLLRVRVRKGLRLLFTK